jgi:hypothetical protein
MRLFDLGKAPALMSNSTLSPFICAQISSGVRGQKAPGFGCLA